MSNVDPDAPSGLTSHAQSPNAPPIVLSVALGALLVLYSYLGGLWLTRHGPTPELLDTVRAWINIPFGVGADFGVLGIALLLTTSGYQTSAAVAARSATDLARTYRRSWLGPAVALIVLLGAALAGHQWAASWGSVTGGLICAAALVLTGHVLCRYDNARLEPWPSMLLTLGCLTIVVLVSSSYSELSIWYPLLAVYTLLIFLLTTSRGHRLAATAPVRWLGSRGYGLAAGVGVVGYPLLTVLDAKNPRALAYPIVLIALVCCAEGSVRLGRTLVGAVSGGRGDYAR